MNKIATLYVLIATGCGGSEFTASAEPAPEVTGGGEATVTTAQPRSVVAYTGGAASTAGIGGSPQVATGGAGTGGRYMGTGGQTCPTGSTGCRCFVSGGCQAGDSCVSGICVGPDPNDGKIGAHCAAGAKCDIGAVCFQDGFCYEQGSTQGKFANGCLKDGTCYDPLYPSLACNSGICG